MFMLIERREDGAGRGMGSFGLVGLRRGFLLLLATCFPGFALLVLGMMVWII